MLFLSKVNFCIVCSLLFTLCSHLKAETSKEIYITFKDVGRSISVAPVSIHGDIFTFMLNGKTQSIHISKVADHSRVEINKAFKQAASDSNKAFHPINQAIGHNLFLENSLWEEQAMKIATRINWPIESLKDDSASYRLYPPPHYSFLGAHPYSATLYAGTDGTPTRISLIFANKGDYASIVGSGKDHFKKVRSQKSAQQSLQKAIKHDADTISKTLTKHLKRNPIRQYYGEKSESRRVSRWDYKDHSFLLTSIDNQYTSLLIVDNKNANSKGFAATISDSGLKKKLLKNVSTQPNGDIVIKNIPMVNQGPKGYCAPATFERAMTYMNIPADMYELATTATYAGGGTNTTLLADNCKHIIRSKSRRIRELKLEKDLKIKNIKHFINKGIPILWQMRSLNSYNALINQKTAQRRKVTDFRTWASSIKKEAQQLSSKFKSQEVNHHICMIIGYNEKTQELAVSDSWGLGYELRWVHIDIAQSVTSPGGFVIDF